MEQMKKQTETRGIEAKGISAQRIVGILFGIVEIFLAFRLVFKGLGANPENVFVKGIYDITQFIVGLFEGIFSQFKTSGAETTAVLEPATLIAMLVIALIAWLVLKLMTPHKSSSVERTEYSEHDDTRQ